MSLRADVCIVGAGAAGMTVAHALRESGRSVLLLESGPLIDPGALDGGEIVGLPYNGLTIGRRRGVGGTTTVWPGQCMRLRPADEARWPFALGAWYDAAERLFGLIPGETLRDPWELFREPGPSFDKSRIECAVSVFARNRNLGQLDVGAAQLLTGTTVTAVEPGRAETRSLDGTTREIRAETFVLCGGTLEVTRLLLASGNRHEALGRFFQDHVACRPARIVGGSARAFQDLYGLRLAGGLRYSPKLLLKDASPGALANIVFEYDPTSPVQAALRFRRSRGGRDLLRAAAGAPQLASAGLRVLRGREPAPRPEAVRLLAVLEQLPRAESRLSLAEEIDPLGMPRLRVDWQLGDEERRSLEALVTTLDEELQRTGAGALEPEPWLGDGDAWLDHVFDVFHPAGTTRIGDVVDADCALDGSPGIYVCSSSVFPTSGCANPTLTIVALALRLADHLKRT